MSKYIKVFDTLEEYTTYSGSTGFVSPNISYVKANDKSYYDNNEIKHYTQDTWLEVIPKEEYTDTTFDIKKAVYKVDIPNGVTTIGASAFTNYSILSSITIPNSVISIGNDAFKNCNNLPIENNIRYADTYLVGKTSNQETYIIKDGTKFIGNAAFRSCSTLTSITIPNSVISIGSDAFRSCTKLKRLNSDVDGIFNIPNGIININDEYTFLDVPIVTLNIPNTVNYIGKWAFYYCQSMTSVNFGSGLTSLGQQCFRYCTNLTSITLPNSVISIATQSFEGCTSLTSITINAVTPPSLVYNAFDGTNNCPIYVPSESVDAYKSATGWSGHKNRIQAIPNN